MCIMTLLQYPVHVVVVPYSVHTICLKIKTEDAFDFEHPTLSQRVEFLNAILMSRLKNMVWSARIRLGTTE